MRPDAMRKCLSLIFVSSAVLALSGTAAFAENAGGRGAFAHSGWAGARYVASGMTGEILADDVFSIYWNPAGLSELETRKKISEQKIKEDADKGKLEDITEEDILNFSEDGSEEMFFSLGASATRLDVERDALFSGVAFTAFGGVLGVGAFSLLSGDIETRDESGNKTGTADYSGSVGYLSYSISGDIFNFGVTVKGLHEQIGDSVYAGAGSDLGIQVSILPFLKAGFMLRDLGSFLAPYDAPDSEERYDFILPQVKGGILFISDSGVRFSLCGGRKLEQSEFEYGLGIEYKLSDYLLLNAGIDNGFFSAGMTLTIGFLDMSYAFSFDRIDYGYNNTVSIGMLF